MENEKEITFLLPCLNEEKTIPETIMMIKQFIKRTKISAEIVVIDNGSKDNSIGVAKKLGAIVKKETNKGYGNALRRGLKEATGKYIIMGDCDTTYDFEHIGEFIKKLNEGYDLVIGNRYKGGIEKGAMPWTHRYLGVPFLSYLGRKKYNVNIGDFHCGLRGINSKTIKKLNFKTSGMEFATEMIYIFSKNNKKITEVPTVLKKCSDISRKPHLNAIRDGFRHLKFIYKNT